MIQFEVSRDLHAVLIKIMDYIQMFKKLKGGIRVDFVFILRCQDV